MISEWGFRISEWVGNQRVTKLGIYIPTILGNNYNPQQFLLWKMRIQWENGWGGLKRIFLLEYTDYKQKSQKKSVSIRPICRIRSPIVSAFSKGETVTQPISDFVTR